MTTSETTISPAKPICFVIQSPQDARLDRLYNELFRSAILEAQLTPYRPAVTPGEPPALEEVAAQIRASSACFADLTEESPYAWFALGCATALGKPLCVIASTAHGAAGAFAASYPDTIFYPALPLPSDYQRLQKQITNRLLLLPSPEEAPKPGSAPEAILTPLAPSPMASATIVELPLINPGAPEQAVNAQAFEVEEPSSLNAEAIHEPISLSVADIRVHELLALSIIARGEPTRGTTLRALALEMHKHGAAQATSLSINGLCRKRLAERRLIAIEGNTDGHREDCLFLSTAGRAWIEANNLSLAFDPPPLDADPDSLMDLIHAL